LDLLLDIPGEYDESIGIEHYTLPDAPGVEVVVPPGQHQRREATGADLLAGIAAGKYRGIVLVVSYGHQSFSLPSYKDHPLYANSKDEFLRQYLEDRRNDELTVLRQLAPHLRVSKGKLWLLTLVAKQDLWWPSRSEVDAYYRTGAYGAEIPALQNQQDRRSFRHELTLASLVISNFVTRNGERLKPNVEGYDHREHARSLRRLFETVDALRKWEGES
jgi:hypothetical protein